MEPLHIVLVPMVAPGHMIPMLDMAKVFASRGIKTSIISPLEYADPILRARASGLDIGLLEIDFPPQGCELPEVMTTPNWLHQFVNALALLQDPVEKLLKQLQPNALISDTFLPWTLDSAAKLGIPRLIFYPAGYLPMCVLQQIRLHKPYKNSDFFTVPNLPHELTFQRSQVSLFEQQIEEEVDDPFINWLSKMNESNEKSYGAVFNTFYELEPDYADHWREVMGRKAWQMGPLFLSNDGPEEKARRGKKAGMVVQDRCLAWLDSKRVNSVVYVCFGTTTTFTPTQLHETAIGLEASGQDFIWVVGKREEENEDRQWLPQGFEERMESKSKGLIVRGWAPQLAILEHPGVGAFVTHCGWGSVLEGVCAGLPMVTWPVTTDHFYIEKLLTNVLGIGASVGNTKWAKEISEGVSSEAIANAVKGVMLGEEGVEMTRRAKHYKELARKAVERGGSSYTSLTELMDELRNYPQVTAKGKDASLEL